MPIVVDLYIDRESWVHRLDPRVKFLFVAVFLFLLLFFKNIFIMLTALLLVHALHWSAKMPLEKFKFIWKTLLPIALLMTGMWTVFYPTGTSWLQIWFITIAPLSLVQGLVLGLRIFSMAFVVFAWLYTTDPPKVVRGLVKLKMPYEWGLVLTLALRYIPTFQSTYGVISDAQQARGLDITQGKGFRRVRVLMPIFVAMVISSMRASDQLSKALESRAFGAKGVRRTVLRDIHYRPIDYVITALILLLLVASIYARIRYDFGIDTINLIGVTP